MLRVKPYISSYVLQYLSCFHCCTVRYQCLIRKDGYSSTYPVLTTRHNLLMFISDIAIKTACLTTAPVSIRRPIIETSTLRSNVRTKFMLGDISAAVLIIYSYDRFIEMTPHGP